MSPVVTRRNNRAVIAGRPFRHAAPAASKILYYDLAEWMIAGERKRVRRALYDLRLATRRYKLPVLSSVCALSYDLVSPCHFVSTLLHFRQSSL